MRLFPILALIAIPALAERIDFAIDAAVTKVNWTLGGALHTVHGTFRVKKGELWLDTGNGQAGGLLVVDATSGESGSEGRDSRMHKNVLESDRYPEITFAPDRMDGRLARTGDSEVPLHGMFTIHGGTHEVLMKVKSHLEQGKATATIAFIVPYVKWGMKSPSTFLLKMKDFVEIEIQAEARIK